MPPGCSRRQSEKHQIWRRYGINISLSPQVEEVFSARVNDLPSEIAGVKVAGVIRVEGTIMLLSDGSWLLFRKSGTEPVVRLYG